MAIRNFWIEGEIDGRASVLTVGPARKDGGFDLVIKQRNQGCIDHGVRVTGRADADGKLVLRVHYNGQVVVTNETKR